MNYTFPPALTPSVAVAGSDIRFPVHRIYCIGRNYAEHAKEMGMAVDRATPVFFCKPADAVVADRTQILYPLATTDLHDPSALQQSFVALETSSDIEPIRQVCEDVFASWRTTFAKVLRDAGVAEADAEPLATFILSSYEGALTMSRALRDIQPMLTSGAAVASVLHSHLGDTPRAG